MADKKELRKAHPDTWIPVENGDYLDGIITDVTDAWSDVRNGGSFYPLLTVKGHASGYGDGELKVHAFGAVLFNELNRHRPEVGEHVIITYVGEGEAKRKGYNAPQLYRVTCPDRKDTAQRAYGRVFGDNQVPVVQAEPEPDPPRTFQAEPEPDPPRTLEEAADRAADDIPF